MKSTGSERQINECCKAVYVASMLQPGHGYIGPCRDHRFEIMVTQPLPAKQTKLHVLSIPLKKNGEYMELGLFSRQTNLLND